jgi:uncharacterized coiled-coil DUF342 family protein
MKKMLLIGLLVIVAIGGTLLSIKIISANKQTEEFYSFREYLDKEYFPLLEDTRKHITKAGETTDAFARSEWYVLENGIEENFELNKRLDVAKEKIINKDVKYEDTLALKENILNSITQNKKVLKTVETYNGIDDSLIYDELFSEEVDKLSKDIDEMNEILGKYYE